MIVDNNLAAVKDDGIIDLKATGSDAEIKGNTIHVQRSFKTDGTLIPESETPFGYAGMRLEIMPLKGKPADTFVKNEIAGSGNIIFEVYDGDPATDATPDHLVATYGPFDATQMNAVGAGNPIVSAVIPSTAKGKILLKSKCNQAKGTGFTGGYLFARWVPNI